MNWYHYLLIAYAASVFIVGAVAVNLLRHLRRRSLQIHHGVSHADRIHFGRTSPPQ